jgi:DNA-binding transcriptional LysR family regulator
MDTRFLGSLVTVIECGSIAEAARRLGVTPAAIKQRVRAVEAEVGATLLVRSGRVVRPTMAAAALLDRARAVLEGVRDLTSIGAGDSLRGEIRLFAMQTALSGLVPDILSRLSVDHPQIGVRIFRGSSVEAYQKVFTGDVDAAITSEPSFAIPKSFQWVVLREEPFVVLTPAHIRTRDPFKVLEQEPFIRLDRNVYAGRMIDTYLRRKGIEVKQIYELDGLEAIVIMVDRGLGVTLLPDWAPPWPAGLSLRKLRVPDASLKRTTGLLWQRASLRAGLIQALLETARTALAPPTQGRPRPRAP